MPLAESRLRRLLKNSTALRTAVVFGLAGVGYALGNLLLARALPRAQFGVFTLFLALVQMGASLAPLGLEGQVNRRPGGLVHPGRPLVTSAVVAFVTAIIGWTLYGMNAVLAVALIISITAGGISRVAAAIFQSQLRFGSALSLSQGLAVALLGMGIFAVIAEGAEIEVLAALVAGYYVISAGVGWGVLSRQKRAGAPAEHSVLEGLSLLGITAAALLLMQLERLLAPRLLTLEDLATFAVATTLVGSPFRMLQMGAGYTLLPRLSTAPTREARRRLVRHEAFAVTLIAGAGALAILLAAPWIARWLLAGKYELGAVLMIAALVSGTVKLGDGFATTMVWALGRPRELALLNWVSWACAVVGIVGGWIGARWGLIGLMYGVTFAWICRGAVAATLAAKLLQAAPIAAAPRPASLERIPS
jgi:O-antigen/teichoic acid export membrane protein